MSAKHSSSHVFPSCLYVCVPIRYPYQSAVGSRNTEASLFASCKITCREMEEGKVGERKTEAEKGKKMRRGSSGSE